MWQENQSETNDFTQVRLFSATLVIFVDQGWVVSKFLLNFVKVYSGKDPHRMIITERKGLVGIGERGERTT